MYSIPRARDTVCDSSSWVCCEWVTCDIRKMKHQVVNNTQEEYTEMICILFQELEILMGLFVIVAAGCWVCCECVTCDIRKMKNKVDNGDFGN